MRYYIYSNNKPTEVSEHVYHQWEVSDKYNYSFEDCLLVMGNTSFLIQVAYLGVFDEYELARPFVLSYTQKIKLNGKEKAESIIEYYYTYEVVTFRRKQLIRQIKTRLLPVLLN